MKPRESKIALFVDPNQDPQYYIDRYNNEERYKEWFDDNYSQYDSIHQAVGLDEEWGQQQQQQCGIGTHIENGFCIIDAEPKCGLGMHAENRICVLDKNLKNDESFLDSIIKVFSNWFR